MRAYAPESPNWSRWFALEHEEKRRQGVHVDHDVPPPLPEVPSREQDEKAAYQAALELAPQQAREASRIEEGAQWDGMDRTLALSAAGDSVHAPLFNPPSPPPPLPIVEPKPDLNPTRKHSPPPPSWREEAYTWTDLYHKWVSVPRVHYAATPEEEAAHLERWKAHSLAQEDADGERQML